MQSRSHMSRRTAALCFSLALLPSSLVLAEPSDRESTERVSYDGRGQPRAAVDDDGWFELATPTPASHGREFIVIEPDARPLARVRLTAVTGRPIVRAVRLELADGTSRTVRVDRALDAKHPHIIELPARAITSLVVISEGSKRATYGVSGSSARSMQAVNASPGARR
jgi:hypothetical protein